MFDNIYHLAVQHVLTQFLVDRGNSAGEMRHAWLTDELGLHAVAHHRNGHIVHDTLFNVALLDLVLHGVHVTTDKSGHIVILLLDAIEDGKDRDGSLESTLFGVEVAFGEEGLRELQWRDFFLFV